MGELGRVIRGKMNVWACFALRNFENTPMAIRMCSATDITNTITITVRYGDSRWKRNVQLPHDLVFTLQMLQIDWSPEEIMFKVSKQIIGSVTHKEMRIPDEGLYIKVFLLPKTGKHDDISNMGGTMSTSAMWYKGLNHDELFTMPKRSTSEWGIFGRVFILIFGVAFILTVCYCIVHRHTNYDHDRYYAFPEDFG